MDFFIIIISSPVSSPNIPSQSLQFTQTKELDPMYTFNPVDCEEYLFFFLSKSRLAKLKDTNSGAPSQIPQDGNNFFLCIAPAHYRPPFIALWMSSEQWHTKMVQLM